MPYEGTGYAPWSLTREAGVESATVDGTIQVPQYVYPNLDTGFIDERGVWQGRKSTDRDFIDLQRDESIADQGDITSNKVIDMYGFSKLNIAIQPSRSGDYYFELLFGGDDNDGYLNLKPINTAIPPKATIRTDSSTNAFVTLLADQQSVTADLWTIFQVNDVGDFKIKLKIINRSGGASTIQTAIQRLV